MDNEKVDLSSLAPDPTRWQAVLQATMTRVERTMDDKSREDALVAIAGWSRPLLFAAAAALAILIPIEFALERQEAKAAAARRLASVSVAWIATDRTPSGAEILRTIAEGGER